jgi:hypothetical protein
MRMEREQRWNIRKAFCIAVFCLEIGPSFF